MTQFILLHIQHSMTFSHGRLVLYNKMTSLLYSIYREKKPEAFTLRSRLHSVCVLLSITLGLHTVHSVCVQRSLSICSPLKLESRTFQKMYLIHWIYSSDISTKFFSGNNIEICIVVFDFAWNYFRNDRVKNICIQNWTWF